MSELTRWFFCVNLVRSVRGPSDGRTEVYCKTNTTLSHRGLQVAVRKRGALDGDSSPRTLMYSSILHDTRHSLKHRFLLLWRLAPSAVRHSRLATSKSRGGLREEQNRASRMGECYCLIWFGYSGRKYPCVTLNSCRYRRYRSSDEV